MQNQKKGLTAHPEKKEERRIYLPEERGLGKRERERDAPAKQPTKIEGRW